MSGPLFGPSVVSPSDRRWSEQRTRQNEARRRIDPAQHVQSTRDTPEGYRLIAKSRFTADQGRGTPLSDSEQAGRSGAEEWARQKGFHTVTPGPKRGRNRRRSVGSAHVSREGPRGAPIDPGSLPDREVPRPVSLLIVRPAVPLECLLPEIRNQARPTQDPPDQDPRHEHEVHPASRNRGSSSSTSTA